MNTVNKEQPKKKLVTTDTGKIVYLSQADHNHIQKMVGVNQKTEGIYLVKAMVGFIKSLRPSDIIKEYN